MTEGQLRAAMRAGFNAGESHLQIVNRVMAAHRAAGGGLLARLNILAGYEPRAQGRARFRFRGLDVTEADQ
jgi:hypothetical protein